MSRLTEDFDSMTPAERAFCSIIYGKMDKATRLVNIDEDGRAWQTPAKLAFIHHVKRNWFKVSSRFIILLKNPGR